MCKMLDLLEMIKEKVNRVLLLGLFLALCCWNVDYDPEVFKWFFIKYIGAW